jgi:hypothetical protein
LMEPRRNRAVSWTPFRRVGPKTHSDGEGNRLVEPRQEIMDQLVVVELPVDALSTTGSPRTSGVDPAHVRALAAVRERLPPIIVHRPTMRVIDGLHRLKAVRLSGRQTIAVRFFDGEEAEAFVLAVSANVVHGLPLSLADRKRAASRILLTHPRWSTRMVAAAAGISVGTVAEIRRRTLGDTGDGDVRIGRDGKVRPINGAEGRRMATELIVGRPELSLRQIARAAGVSPETVRSLKNRLRSAGDATGAQDGVATPSAWASRPNGPAGLSIDRSRQDKAAVVERLKADPALRFSETGRDLLRLLDINTISPEEWDRLVDIVPPHYRSAVAQLARICAKIWADFAQQVGRGEDGHDLESAQSHGQAGRPGTVQLPKLNGWTEAPLLVSSS